MIIDYGNAQAHVRQTHPESSRSDMELPLRVYRLATSAASAPWSTKRASVVERGGEGTHHSATATGGAEGRAAELALKVYGLVRLRTRTPSGCPDGPGVRQDQVHELFRSSCGISTPRRPPRLPARRHRRPQVLSGYRVGRDTSNAASCGYKAILDFGFRRGPFRAVSFFDPVFVPPNVRRSCTGIARRQPASLAANCGHTVRTPSPPRR